jgi:hypothetical protein
VGRHLLARRKPGVQIPSPPPPTPQVKASPASSRRRSLPCCGRKLTSSSAGKALRDEATRPQASHTDHTAWSPPAADRRAILAHPIQPLPVDHAVEAATAQPPLTTTTKSKLTRRSPSTACTSLKRHTPTSGRRAVVDTAADHAPRPSQPHDCLPHCHAPRPHCGRTQRTLEGTDTRRPPRTPEAGGRTLDTWTLRHPHRTPDTDQLGSHPGDTGRSHRTPTRQGDDSTAGVRTSWASSPSDRILGRPTRSCRSCQPLPNRGGGGTCWESPDLALARVGRVR